MKNMVDETSCPMRCCNKCDMYRKENEQLKNELKQLKEQYRAVCKAYNVNRS